MYFIVIFYFLYNFIAGLFLSIFYFRKEKRIVDNKEFLHLLFFPVTGYGNWTYQSLLREKGSTFYPKGWYKYDKMIVVNAGLLVALFVIPILFPYLPFDVGLDWINHSDNQNALAFGLIAGFGLLIIGALIFMVVMPILIFVLLIYPSNQKKSIERNLEIQHLKMQLKQKEQNENKDLI
jgi:hypothetical protein